MEFDINPNELSLQGPDGMQLVQILRKLIVAIDGGDVPEPTQTSGLYYCTYGTTTSAQISQAITDGLLPVCVYGGRYYYLVYRQVNIFTFASIDQIQLILYRIKCNGSTWSYTAVYLQEYLDFDYAPTEGSTNPVTSGGVWTAIQQGGGGSDIDPYQQYPAMDGTASPGSSDDYARGDHVHPTDTSRAAASEITRIDAALATKADQSSIEQTIEDTVDDWLTVQAPSIGTLSYAAKQALLACFRKVAWIDDQGQTYYNALESELFPDATLESITAVFTQGSATIYDTDSLDTLRQYLVVTANYSDSTSQTVSDYTLTGTLTEGTSTITVSYSGKTTTFTVTVTHIINGWLYEFNGNLLSSGSEDFGLVGTGVYDTGLFNKQCYKHFTPTSGTASSDTQLGLKAIDLQKSPNFSGDFTLSFWSATQVNNYFHPFSYTKYVNSSTPSGYFFSDYVVHDNTWSYTTIHAKNTYAGMSIYAAIATHDVKLSAHSSDLTHSDQLSIVMPASIDTTQWHHYAFTRKGNTMRFFFDGSLKISMTCYGSIYAANQVGISTNFTQSSAQASTIQQMPNGEKMQDLYIAEFCKWESDFNPQTITY